MSVSIVRPESGWMKRLATYLPLLLVSGCVSVGSGKAICDATAALRTLHAEALAEDGGDRSVVTGQSLISVLDAGCEVGLP